MSDLCQIGRMLLTDEHMRELADILAKLLPDDATALVALTDVCLDDFDCFAINDKMVVVELSNGSATNVEQAAERMLGNIRGALAQMTYSDGQSFDEERFPVLIFSIESNFDYYALVTIAVETSHPELVNEMDAILTVVKFLDDNAPEPDDIEEDIPEVYRVFGTFVNRGMAYSLDFVDE